MITRNHKRARPAPHLAKTTIELAARSGQKAARKARNAQRVVEDPARFASQALVRFAEAEHTVGGGVRGERKAVPRREHLVVESRPRAPAARLEETRLGSCNLRGALSGKGRAHAGGKHERTRTSRSTSAAASPNLAAHSSTLWRWMRIFSSRNSSCGSLAGERSALPWSLT